MTLLRPLDCVSIQDGIELVRPPGTSTFDRYGFGRPWRCPVFAQRVQLSGMTRAKQPGAINAPSQEIDVDAESRGGTRFQSGGGWVSVVERWERGEKEWQSRKSEK